MVFLRLAITISLLFACGCSKVFYYPDHNLYYPPEKNGYEPRAIVFPSGDGTMLFAWYFQSKAGRSKGTIVQFHGNAENISSHYASLVWLTKQGYDLFTFDYRGYGKSDGKPDQEGLYKDGMSALDKAWQLHRESGARKFIVYGQSLGGAVALRSFADFRHQPETSLVVADSTFASYRDVAQQKLAAIWLTWIISPLGRVLVSDRFAPQEVIGRQRARLLVIHDRHDPVVDFRNGQKIFELASCKKEFWELDKGRHVGAFALDTSENRLRFVRLLDAI